MDHAGDAQPVVEVVLHFERTEDPILGRVSGTAGEQVFEGWLGLVSALDRALNDREDKSSGCGP